MESDIEHRPDVELPPNGRTPGQRGASSQAAGAVLALISISFALGAQLFLRALVAERPIVGSSIFWAIAFFMFSLAALLALADLRSAGARVSVWRAVLGPAWIEPASGWGSLACRPRPRLSNPIPRAWRAVTRAPFRSALVFSAYGLAVMVTVMLHERADGAGTYWNLLALWSLSVAMFLLAVAWPGSYRPLIHGLRIHRRALIDVGVLWAAGAALRLPGLGTWLPVINGDEGIVGNVSRALADGGTPFGTQYALGTLYYLQHTPLIVMSGGGIAALRLVDALTGSLTAPAAYLAGRQLFGRKVGLATGVLVAAQHMHIHLSRVALGLALDATLAALVLFTFVRGLEKGDRRWMAIAGVGIGLSQYGYVGGRMLGLVYAGFVVALFVLQPGYLARAWRQLAVAAGSALLVALPMIRWAIDRPGEYFTRVHAVGFVQTGGVAYHAEHTGRSAWMIWLVQLRDGLLAIIAHPAHFFYDARVPMLGVFAGALFVLGLGFTIWRLRDRRMMPLAITAFGALAVLALGQNATVAVYRIGGAIPVFSLLAALAIVLLAGGAAEGAERRGRLASVATAVVVALLVVYDLHYYFVEHLPACRYTDGASARASIGAEYISRLPPETAVFALTTPHLDFGAYPSVQYLTQRNVVGLSKPAPQTFGQSGTDVGKVVVTVPEGTGALASYVGASAPAVVLAHPLRVVELAALRPDLPGGQVTSLMYCGEPAFSVLVVGSADEG